MNVHKNARLMPLRREEMARDVVEGRLSKADAAWTYCVTGKIVTRWVERFRVEGRLGMADRSSRPKTSPRRTVAERLVAHICSLYEKINQQGGVLYPVSAFPMSSLDWRQHFGDTWMLLKNAKHRFDREGTLAPGYEVF